MKLPVVKANFIEVKIIKRKISDNMILINLFLLLKKMKIILSLNLSFLNWIKILKKTAKNKVRMAFNLQVKNNLERMWLNSLKNRKIS